MQLVPANIVVVFGPDLHMLFWFEFLHSKIS